ncbi:hypothetical protein [Streptomyces regalis]|uniref:hypothetical protein n=1 Tax=Streptomyces regalis TaxID=68262 RepID=UPI000AA824D4|nr:hypothetical protein [Streptomyces regalis]
MVAYADKYWNHHNGGWGPKGGAIIQRPSNKYWFYGPTTWTTSWMAKACGRPPGRLGP